MGTPSSISSFSRTGTPHSRRLLRLANAPPHALLWAGTNPIGFRTSYDVSFVEIYRADGLHPQYIEGDGAKQLTCLRSYADRLNAIGEIGLDYREGMPSREIQLDCFKAQIELALELDRPVCLHVVKAHHDALKVFASTGIPRGFVHGFRKGQDLADEYLKRGLSLSFGAPLMQSEALQTIAKTMPLHRLLLESDTPPPAAHDAGTGRHH